MPEVYETLAALLEYPTETYPSRISAAGNIATDFVAQVGTLSLTELQELYTRTFDLNPVCALEIGYHLFGENYKRGEFLANLRITEAGFELGQQKQLPDYLPVLLRLLVKLDNKELRASLIGECLIPGIEKMLSSLNDTENPFRHLLEAVFKTLKSEPGLQTGFSVRPNLPVLKPTAINQPPELF